MGIQEPVDKGFREEFVGVDQDLYWLAEHGQLAEAGRALHALRQWAEHPDGTVRKGALAEDRMRRDPDVAVACDDLARLADSGALAGAAEAVRERVRQVEALDYTPAYDDAHHDGWLLHEAIARLLSAGRRVAEGTDGAEAVLEACREASALLDAEADRLFRMLTPGHVTIHVGGPAWLVADTPPGWWPPASDDTPWGGLPGWHLHLVHCRPDRCEIGCDCPHHTAGIAETTL